MFSIKRRKHNWPLTCWKTVMGRPRRYIPKFGIWPRSWLIVGGLASFWNACAGPFIGSSLRASLRRNHTGWQPVWSTLLAVLWAQWAAAAALRRFVSHPVRVTCFPYCPVRVVGGCGYPVKGYSFFSLSLLPVCSGWQRLPCEGLRKYSLEKRHRSSCEALYWSARRP